MTGIRRSIYIPEDEVPGIEEAAHKMERSVSWYLINLHRESLGQKESQKPANPEKFKSHAAKETPVSQTEGYVAAVRNKPTADTTEEVDTGTEKDVDEPVPDESTYDPGEVADTASTKPEIKKPLPKNPKKKAIIAKIKETGHFNPQPKKKDKK